MCPIMCLIAARLTDGPLPMEGPAPYPGTPRSHKNPDAGKTRRKWTNTSLAPPSGSIKPKPRQWLKNFTVPPTRMQRSSLQMVQNPTLDPGYPPWPKVYSVTRHGRTCTRHPPHVRNGIAVHHVRTATGNRNRGHPGDLGAVHRSPALGCDTLTDGLGARARRERPAAHASGAARQTGNEGKARKGVALAGLCGNLGR